MDQNPLARGRRNPASGLAVQAMFAQAVRLHQAGRSAQAERICRDILKLDPRHADSLHLLGVIAHQGGQHNAAIDLIGQAVRLRGEVPFYHVNLGNALRAAGRPDDAVRRYRRALALSPDLAEAHCNLAATLRQLRRPEEAETHYRRAVALRPNVPEFHNDLGAVLSDQQQLATAATEFERAIALRPSYPEAHNNLGNAMRRLDRPADAVACYERALAARPDYPEALNNLGGALEQQRRFDEAMTHYQRALALRPDYPEAHNNLGNALRAQGRLAEAAERYRRAVAINPAYAEAHSNLGNILVDQDQPAAAEACYRRALELRPDLAEAHYNLANALELQDRLAEAETHYRHAITLRPGVAEVHNNLGNILRDLGRPRDAEREYETAVRLGPRTGRYYRHLFELRRAAPGDPHLAALEAQVPEMAALEEADQVEMHFALGKTCADQGQFARSFRHFSAGNALRRRAIDYDEADALGLIERIRAAFTADLLAERRGAGDPSEAPVFIVGMPRSGTTLVEQILASHPAVFGGGERRDFTLAVADLEARGGGRSFTELAPALPPETLRALGARYAAAVSEAAMGAPAVSALAASAARITDKMPGNFHFVGLIHLALPNARIIHVRRDPIDSCLSCFTQLFRTGQLYSYDPRELGRFYRAYDGLMAHWRGVLPAGVMLEVRYEDVIADLEREARRIVAHCGLDWDGACLEFHTADRPVRTASAIQVRQPVYTSSVGRWRAYGALLEPLLDELGLRGSVTADRMVG